MAILLGVLLGLLLALWLYDHDDAAGVLDGRAVGLQAGVLAGDTATVRWPSWTPVPTNTPRFYPSWTPVPTSTPRAYPSWTPLPSRTPRSTPSWTATDQVQPTLTIADSTPPPLPTKPCEAPWPFTYNEAQTIAAAARNHLWLGTREEPQTLPQEDEILSIGLYELDLGAPLTDEFRLLPDDGQGRIRVRGFALGIVAVRERADMDDTCRNWAVVSWGGEAAQEARR